MAQQNLILCIDIGGDSIKAAEFSYVPGHSLVLERFAYTEFELSQDELPEDTILKNLSEVISSNGFSAKKVYVSISGKNAFVRFVKVPAMTTNQERIRQIISYEAKQAIPFPADEVVWDSQMIQPVGENDGSEIDAMIIIVKKEEVARITELVEHLGKRIVLIEVAGTACYNCARANNVGANDCQMILDIGGRCSTLVFVDGARFFVRTIPIAGDTITQQIAREFNISYDAAEEMKRKHGYVSLGGAYEDDTGSEVASAVSKIVRNVMTRLHGEINRSINVYRATQHGRKPEKLFLAGGTSILPYAPRFFSEKLRIPVDYFNPFQVVSIGPAVDQQVLSEVAHLFAETIGLALRRIGTSPIEISLLPDYVRKQNEFRGKRPYFYASAAVVLVYLAITYWAYSLQAANIEQKRDQFNNFVMRKQSIQQRVKNVNTKLNVASGQFTSATDLLKTRNNLIAFYSILRSCIPSNVWFSDLSISKSASEAIVNAAAVNAQGESKDVDGKKKDSGLTMDTDSDENNDDNGASESSKNAASDPTTELRWINMTAYVICEKAETKLNDRSAAINNLLSAMKKTKLFKDSETEIILAYDEGRDYCENLTICKFLLSVELQEPIGSAEFEELLSKELSPASATEQE